MKSVIQKALLASVCLMGISGAMAQSEIFGEYKDVPSTLSRFICIDRALSYGENDKLLRPVFGEPGSDDIVSAWQILDENLEVVKEIQFPSSSMTEVYEKKDGESNIWVETERDTHTSDGGYYPYYDSANTMWMDFTDDDASSMATITQTLFNDDENYEMIVPIYGDSKVIAYHSSFLMRVTYLDAFVTEYNVVSDSGTVLFSIKAGVNTFFDDHCSVLRIGDKYYLVVEAFDVSSITYYSWERDDSNVFLRFYEINKENGSIKLAREMR